MAKVSTSISIDSEVKAKAQELFADFGMAINIFLKQAIYERSIPFAIRRELPNETTLKAMDEAENDENMHGPFDSVAEMMKALNA